jgi:hypothetical protein
MSVFEDMSPAPERTPSRIGNPRGRPFRWVGDSLPNQDDSISPSAMSTYITLDDGNGGRIGHNHGPFMDPEDGDNHYRNLAEEIDQDTLSDYVQELDTRIKEDRQNLSGMVDMAAKGLKRLGINPEETRSDPFPGASAVRVPIVAQATVEHCARILRELCPPGGMVTTVTAPDPDDAVIDQEDRVGRTMNYLFGRGIKGWQSTLRKTLVQASLFGTAFQKWSMNNDFPQVENVHFKDLLVPWNTTDLRSASRITHVLKLQPYEVRNNMRPGSDVEGNMTESLWLDVPLMEPDERQDFETKFEDQMGKIIGISRPGDQEDDRYIINEVQVRATFEPEIGEDLPYVITYEPTTMTVLAVRRNWWEDDPGQQPRNFIIKWGFVPWDGFYDLGLMHLLGNLNNAGTGALRALIDSAVNSNIPGGFVSKSIKFDTGGDVVYAPWQWTKVEVPGLGTDPDLSKHFMPNSQLGGPNGTLVQLLDKIIDLGTNFTSINIDGLTSAQQSAPVGTTMAVVENESVVYSALHSNTYDTFSETLETASELMFHYLDPNKDVFYRTRQGGIYVTNADFNGVIQVVPSCSQEAFSSVQRVTQQQAITQVVMEFRAQGWDPKMKMTFIKQLKALRAEDPESYWPKPDPPPAPPPPVDPVTEFGNLLAGHPVKAYPGQNHRAHIDSLMARMADERYNKLPAFEQALPSINACIGDHASQMARDDIQNAIGHPLPPDAQLPPQMAFKMAQTQAQVAQKVAAQHPSQDTPTDPEAAKVLEIHRKTIADAAKTQADQQKLQQEAEKTAAQERTAAAERQSRERIEAAKLQSKETGEEMKLRHAKELEDMRLTSHEQVAAATHEHQSQMQDQKLTSTHVLDARKTQADQASQDATLTSQEQLAAQREDSTERIAGANILAQLATSPALAKPALEELGGGDPES